MFSCVSLKSDECHAGIWGRSLRGGTSTSAGCFVRENALHPVSKKGYIFHGTRRGCSHGRKRGSTFTPCDADHALMCVGDRLGTAFGSCRNFTNAVACCHAREVRG